MAEWYGDTEFLDEEIAAEESVACSWEADVAELTSGDWEQLMSGPDDWKFERMDELTETASDRAIEEERSKFADSDDWPEWEESEEYEEDTYEGESMSVPYICLTRMDDIPF